MKERPWQSKRWMYNMLVRNRMTQAEVARAAKTDQATISRWAKRHGIQ